MFLKLIINYSACVKYRTGSKSSMVLQIKALWESLSPSCKLSITRSFAIHWSNKFLINILLFLWNATSSTSYSVSSSKLFVVLGFFYLGSGRRNTASSLKAGQSLFDKCLKTAKKKGAFLASIIIDSLWESKYVASLCLFSSASFLIKTFRSVEIFSFGLRYIFDVDVDVKVWCSCLRMSQPCEMHWPSAALPKDVRL